MKKAAVILLAALLCAVYGARVYQVNTSKYVQYFPTRVLYDRNEPVPLTNGHYYFTSYDWEGYSVAVTGSRFVKTADFLETYHVTDDFIEDHHLQPTAHGNHEYVLLVSAVFSFSGENAQEKDPIYLDEFEIVGPDFVLQTVVDFFSLPEFNPVLQGHSSFAIVSGKPLEVEIPYFIDTDFETGLSPEYVESSGARLVVTYYPEESCIALF